LKLTLAAAPGGVLVQALAALGAGLADPLTVVVTWPGGQRVVAGSGEIREQFGGFELASAPGAFTQTHTAGAAALYQAALAWLAPAAGGALLDLYSGAGALALQATAGFAPVLAVEAAGPAVAAGRRAAAAAGVAVKFVRADARQAVARLAAAGERFPAVVANPPRTGLHRQIPAGLARLGVQRLAYISCDPGTLARDLGRLAACGFATMSVTPFDLFPQTAQVEALACLQGGRPGAPRGS
jgi:23S rRNA (uracil1939-C5)-methyltransferase